MLTPTRDGEDEYVDGDEYSADDEYLDGEADPGDENGAADADAAVEAAAKSDTTADDDGVVEELTESAAARIPPARSAVPAYVVHEDEYFEYDSLDPDFVPTRRGRGGFDPEADAIARVARYTFRQRAVLALVLAALLCGALGVALTPLCWWACGLAVAGLIGYLAYLRKQVRMEEEIRRRRAARLSRGQQRLDYVDGEPRQAPPKRPAAEAWTATPRALCAAAPPCSKSTTKTPCSKTWTPSTPPPPVPCVPAPGADMRRAAGA